MIKLEKFRNSGAIGALLDEYEKAIRELQTVIAGSSQEELKTIVDNETDDPECVSIQSVLTHVIRAGYNYVIAIRNHLGEKIDFRTSVILDSVDQYLSGLKDMFKYNEQLFANYPDIKLEEFDNNKKIKVRWGQQYDVEQLIEHAIVHVLRHRRQIERFLIKLREINT
jgi:hypothetical protein